MIEVQHEKEIYELKIKRCYLPIIVRTNCSTCGKELIWDLDSDYLSYPNINDEQLKTLFCTDESEVQEHEHKTIIKYKLNINLEILQ